eukprot:scaffold19441_cov214-Skeletonema_marinoi.AAC.3
MIEYSQYPEAANDSIVPDGDIDFDAYNPGEDDQYQDPPPGADELPDPDEDEEIRELNRRSGKGLYVIVAIIAFLAIAALAVGSTLLVQKNRSIEDAQQTAIPPPPSPGASVPTPSTNTNPPTTNAPTVNGTQGNIIPSPTTSDSESSLASNLTDADSFLTGTTTNGTTTGSGITVNATTGTGITANGTSEGGNSTPTTSGTSGGGTGGPVDVVDGATGSNGGNNGSELNDGTTGGGSGSTSGSSTAGGESGGGSAIEGDASDSSASDGSGTLPGDLLGGDIIDGSPTSSPKGDDSSGNDGDNSGVTDGSGSSAGLPLVETDSPTSSVAAVSGAPTTSLGNITATTPPSSSRIASTAPIIECIINGVCSVEGSSCAIGKETCCGETFNSVECDCIGGQWLCRATDACNRPDCDDPITAAPTSTPSSSSSDAIQTESPTIAIQSPQATPTLVPTQKTDAPSVVTERDPSASPSPTGIPTVTSKPSGSPNVSPSASPTAMPSILPTSSPSTFPSNQPTCSISIEVDFVTEDQGNLDKTGYSLLSTSGSKSTTFMEVLPGDLENTTSQIDIACVSNGAYIFTVYDESGKCCGDNKGYYAVKVNGEEVVRGRSYFTSPNAYIIRTDYQAPTAQTKVQWLNKHNEARESFHTEKDVPFAPLVWSDSLAEAAAKRANDIAPTCGSGSATMDPWGENVGRTSFGVYNEALVSPDYVFDGWDSPEDHPLTFRQIMWRPTRYVGCASNITQMDSDGPFCHVAVCYYARPGNCNVNNETWLNETLADYSKCGPPCPDEGCY